MCRSRVTATFFRTFHTKSVLESKNIIASFKPERAKRVMLCAHWDTRPFADQAETNKNTPIEGANDGGSGVAVLLEMARQFSMKKPDVGVDIILFDSEDLLNLFCG